MRPLEVHADDYLFPEDGSYRMIYFITKHDANYLLSLTSRGRSHTDFIDDEQRGMSEVRAYEISALNSPTSQIVGACLQLHSCQRILQP